MRANESALNLDFAKVHTKERFPGKQRRLAESNGSARTKECASLRQQTEAWRVPRIGRKSINAKGRLEFFH